MVLVGLDPADEQRVEWIMLWHNEVRQIKYAPRSHGAAGASTTLLVQINIEQLVANNAK